jgi:hypothetical protein
MRYEGKWTLSKKWLIGGGVLACVVLTCIAVLASRSELSSRQPTGIEASRTDPYQQYLALNPDPDLLLSREDAQARAFLGCGTTWAPGTIDAVLAEVYRPTGICAVPTVLATEEVVHPGSFCAPAGAVGVTSAGAPMVCRTTASDSRPRWRQPE